MYRTHSVFFRNNINDVFIRHEIVTINNEVLSPVSGVVLAIDKEANRMSVHYGRQSQKRIVFYGVVTELASGSEVKIGSKLGDASEMISSNLFRYFVRCENDYRVADPSPLFRKGFKCVDVQKTH